MIKRVREAEDIVGGLSQPSKMPGLAYGIPAKYCSIGSFLRDIKGSVCANCYALKGRYVFENVKKAQQRRFSSLTDPQWVDAMVFLMHAKKCEWFRWHDAGDLQGIWHLENICEVARRCQILSSGYPHARPASSSSSSRRAAWFHRTCVSASLPIWSTSRHRQDTQ